MPVGLGHDGHTIACRLEHTPDDGSTERRMVDVGITREQDDIERVPSPQFHFFFGGWQKISQPVVHLGLGW